MFDFNVRVVTCNETTTNFSTMKKMGCVIGSNPESFSGKFYHGNSSQPCYYFPDPPHMLKLGRNALSFLGCFVDSENRLVKWDFIVKLHDVQVKEGLKFGNKLSAKHINFHQVKMNVKLAAHVLSNSVATAIEFLMNSNHPDFKHAEGTIHFIRTIDRLFDLLNTKNPFGKGYKTPLRLKDKPYWEETIDSSVSYLLGLKDINETPLYLHRRKTLISVQ